MISTIEKNDNKSFISIDKLLQEICSLSKWEKIKTIALTGQKFWFSRKTVNVDLYRRFSVKNSVEKYMIKDSSDRILGNMDLKIYKDSVYIINLQIFNGKSFEQSMLLFLQLAAEKALYSTSQKELYINLLEPFFVKNKMKKIILENGFFAIDNQSVYEKELFGEAFELRVSESLSWIEKIRHIPLLINK